MKFVERVSWQRDPDERGATAQLDPLLMFESADHHGRIAFRYKKLDPYRSLIESYVDQGYSNNRIAQELKEQGVNVNHQTVSSYLDSNGIQRRSINEIQSNSRKLSLEKNGSKSRLDPYREIIEEMSQEGRSDNEIADFLEEQYGLETHSDNIRYYQIKKGISRHPADEIRDRRTREALDELKAKGTRLGRPPGTGAEFNQGPDHRFDHQKAQRIKRRKKSRWFF